MLIAAFVRHALRATRPLLDLQLFRVRAFWASSATTFVLGGALFGAMILMPLYYQLVHGASALEAGLLLAPQGLGVAVAMPIAGRLADRLGPGRIVRLGLGRRAARHLRVHAGHGLDQLRRARRRRCSSAAPASA